MERFVRDSIQLYLTWNSVLNDVQYKFRSNMLPLTNLLYAQRDLSSLRDTKKDVFMIVFVLSKTFNLGITNYAFLAQTVLHVVGSSTMG